MVRHPIQTKHHCRDYTDGQRGESHNLKALLGLQSAGAVKGAVVDRRVVVLNDGRRFAGFHGEGYFSKSPQKQTPLIGVFISAAVVFGMRLLKPK